MTRIVIIGGGPAGYEAALVAAQLGAEVTVVERDGIGGASVLTDCVPSKTLIAAAGAMTAVRDSAGLAMQGTQLTEVDLRSEEHTSELQSHVNLVCRLLLEKKKRKNNTS